MGNTPAKMGVSQKFFQNRKNERSRAQQNLMVDHLSIPIIYKVATVMNLGFCFFVSEALFVAPDATISWIGMPGRGDASPILICALLLIGLTSIISLVGRAFTAVTASLMISLWYMFLMVATISEHVLHPLSRIPPEVADPYDSSGTTVATICIFYVLMTFVNGGYACLFYYNIHDFLRSNGLKLYLEDGPLSQDDQESLVEQEDEEKGVEMKRQKKPCPNCSNDGEDILAAENASPTTTWCTRCKAQNAKESKPNQ